ncbi:uncharacterized protein LOC141904938 [Tubulanus polymorphus]|uniref:uncharacterized protein LOC141904938 n=1 Tax=Tubulanus polymorphus TaxID=672921 RepID=UPI003DA2C9DC
MDIEYFGVFALMLTLYNYAVDANTISRRSCVCKIVSREKSISAVEMGKTEFEAYPFASCHQVRRSCRKYCKDLLKPDFEDEPLRRIVDGHPLGYGKCLEYAKPTGKNVIKLHAITEVQHCSKIDQVDWHDSLCCGPTLASYEQDVEPTETWAWMPKCNGLEYVYL